MIVLKKCSVFLLSWGGIRAQRPDRYIWGGEGAHRVEGAVGPDARKKNTLWGKQGWPQRAFQALQREDHF